jgi:hypothetical protein
MPQSPKLHHLVPAFYLAGFTKAGTHEGKLHVFDYLRNRHYSSSPRQVGRQKDFFRINEPGVDPYVLERELGKVESDYGAILQEIKTENRISKPQHRSEVLELAALIYAKTSRSRQQLAAGLARSLLRKLTVGEVNEDEWEKIRQAELRAGADPSSVPPFDVVRELVVRGTWTPIAPRILQVGMVGEVFEMMLDALSQRRWELMRTDADSNGGFITSDNPLTWGDVPRADVRSNNPRIDDPDVEVTFPLSQSAALVSYRGARAANFQATDSIVAHINSRTLFLCNGAVYFGRQPFLLEREGGMGLSDDYFAYVKEARERGIIRP